jgi:acetyl-CoA C-acetyltransferase
MPQPVIVAGARTPIGKLLGALAPLSAPQLAGAAIAAALDRAGITGEQVDAVIIGNVIQAGVGPNPARLGAVAGGIPMRVPASTVNKLCLSGLAAIAQAAALVTAGYNEIVVQGPCKKTLRVIRGGYRPRCHSIVLPAGRSARQMLAKPDKLPSPAAISRG